jgi:polygalacturonase
MKLFLMMVVGALVSVAAPSFASAQATATTKPAGLINVRNFGAAGDGKALDTPAINEAIDAANAAGGGTVFFPAGDYLATSIHLKSHVALYLDQGATIVAAHPDPEHGVSYDPPEKNEFDAWQDFGHSHWHNSLIWGENLEDVSILGPGTIWGKGLVRSGSQSRTKEQNEELKKHDPSNPEQPTTRRKFGYPSRTDAVEPGWGNKSIALKLCRNVIIRDVSIKHGGHFAILATGVDNFTLDGVKIDTNRDGVDLDCCQNVRMSNCSVNSPFDDGICPKSSFALGYNRPCENITISNCQVSGYDEGTFLDGTFKRNVKYGHGGPTGRIKFGTESNGGFKNITISNCVFAYCRGLALESVDGALLEDVSISNITMRDIVTAPIFLRLGSRLRGPEAKVGTLRRVIIDNVVCYNGSTNQSCIISGVPGHDIEDLTISNVRLFFAGGGTKEQAATQPAEKEDAYPEPTMFGETPSYGFFVRHVKNLTLNDVQVRPEKPDARPPLVLQDVKGADLFRVTAPHAEGTKPLVLKDVTGLTARFCPGIPDTNNEQSAAAAAVRR